ncbi:MAG TPA: TolC family protein [Gemmataceae bacterium]|nr:TolC family protein [Gemmataceae bacterium]
MLLLVGGLLCGCTRAHYRVQADNETYHIIEERNQDPRWEVPRISVDVPPQSRLFDPFDPDHTPMPPDDRAADKYMQCVFGMHGYRHWHRDGDAPWIEDPDWKNYLELDKEGRLVLTPDKAVEVGILNSPNYQTQIENLYLASLTVTLDRFGFELQWFGTNDTTYTHFGSSADELNTLSTNSTIGFNRFLASGGQIMAELANSFVFQYAGGNSSVGFSNIIVNYMQPLLQNAGRAVALETLTEAERTLLYTLRTFAHYRKQFTFQIATNTFLSLLTQQQGVRNSQANIQALELSLRLNTALLDAGKLAAINVEQIDLSLQQGQQQLIQLETSLATAEDAYKLLLGLPPSLPIRLDDSLLAQFQLNDPALTALQGEIDDFQAVYRQVNQAALGKLREGIKKLETFRARTIKLVDEVSSELDRLKDQIKTAEKDQAGVRARSNAAQVAVRLTAVREELDDQAKKSLRLSAALAENNLRPSTEGLARLGGNLSETLAELFVLQLRVRVYLIQLHPTTYDVDEATAYAFNNRLDLMNQEAQVVDAWRQLTVTASALKAGLNLVTSANIATPPLGNHPFDFRASASTYSVGVQIDTPLNRLAQRNAYRASQIAYQQARRSYMILQDSISEAIRDDIRQLRLNRISFEISRQSLVSAALQYEAAREDLLSSTNAKPTSTLDTLNALNGLLGAENSLIGTWAAYETTRYRLLLDMEALQLDDRGLYIDGHDNAAGQSAAVAPQDSGGKTLPKLP